jgi:hypothetical protein
MDRTQPETADTELSSEDYLARDAALAAKCCVTKKKARLKESKRTAEEKAKG